MEVFFTNNDVLAMLKNKFKGHISNYITSVTFDYNKMPIPNFDISKMTRDGWSMDELNRVNNDMKAAIWNWTSQPFSEDAPLEMELVDINPNDCEISWIVTECFTDEDTYQCDCDAECACSDCGCDCDGE